MRPLSGLIILSGLAVYSLVVAAKPAPSRPRAATAAVIPYNSKGGTDRAGLGNPASVKTRVDEILFPENEKTGDAKEKPATNAQ